MGAIEHDDLFFEILDVIEEHAQNQLRSLSSEDIEFFRSADGQSSLSESKAEDVARRFGLFDLGAKLEDKLTLLVTRYPYLREYNATDWKSLIEAHWEKVVEPVIDLSDDPGLGFPGELFLVELDRPLYDAFSGPICDPVKRDHCLKKARNEALLAGGILLATSFMGWVICTASAGGLPVSAIGCAGKAAFGVAVTSIGIVTNFGINRVECYGNYGNSTCESGNPDRTGGGGGRDRTDGPNIYPPPDSELPHFPGPNDREGEVIVGQPTPIGGGPECSGNRDKCSEA